MDVDHQAIEDLLGAYALNSVDPHEAALVASHVDHCHDCRAELDQHLEVAALLPTAAEFAPSSVWDSLAGAIADQDLPEMQTNAATTNVVGFRRRWAGPLAAAAAFVLVAGAAVVQSVRVGDMSSELAAERATVASLSEQLERPIFDTAVDLALGDPSSQRVVLGSDSSGANAIIVLMPDGTGYLAEHTLRPLPADRTYQLWAIVDGKVISAGILGSEPGVVPFHIDPEGFEGFAITEEVIGGVPASENAPVVAWLAA